MNVIDCCKTNLYDTATTADDALVIMRNTYNGANWIAGADLHHALLGRGLGGGVAYKGTICNEEYGFGVSSGMRGLSRTGGFVDVDSSTIWELYVFTHGELQHHHVCFVLVYICCSYHCLLMPLQCTFQTHKEIGHNFGCKLHIFYYCLCCLLCFSNSIICSWPFNIFCIFLSWSYP